MADQAYRTVTPGQVWEDRDSRDRGRRIRIDTVSDSGPNPFVTATTVANPGKPWLVGKGQTELRADGLRRRWRLVPAETEVSRG